MENTIKAVIFDWAGTTVDFGSNAPVAAFIQAFEVFGITPTVEETRAPMGMQKRAHIETMLSGEHIAALWSEQYGRSHTQEDVNNIYAAFEPSLFSSLKEHATPLPGVVDTVLKIRDMGIKIGSTTGYTSAMMDIVAPVAKEKGYWPDCLVCPDEVGGIGRPYPYMLWRNLEKLGVTSICEVVKIGDTAADMQEGKNAGCITVGVIKGSNMLGLSEEEFSVLSNVEMAAYFENATKKYRASGADYVIDDITALPQLLDMLNKGDQ